MNGLFRPPAKPLRSGSLLRKFAAGSYRIAGLLSARTAVGETVATRVHLNLSPNEAWNHIMLYEEVPGQPPFFLRVLLPSRFEPKATKPALGQRSVAITRKGSW